MIPEVSNYLDGNSAAGALRELFAVDVTSAHTCCSGCGHVAAFAESRVYLDAPGMIARCADCDAILLRAVTTPTGTYLDLSGMTYLMFPAMSE